MAWNRADCPVSCPFLRSQRVPDLLVPAALPGIPSSSPLSLCVVWWVLPLSAGLVWMVEAGVFKVILVEVPDRSLKEASHDQVPPVCQKVVDSVLPSKAGKI